MGCFIDNRGNYYEGDRMDIGHMAVEKREPVYDIEEKLLKIDMDSIREIRAWVASQKEAPEIIKQLESDAIKEREKIEIWKTSSELTSSI